MATVFTKLQFKNAAEILLLNAPDEFRTHLAEIGAVARIDERQTDGKCYPFVLVFVKSAAQIAQFAASATQSVEEDGLLWFAYPKKASKRYATDISRDHGWQPLGDLGYEPVRQVALDADWSALRFRQVDQIKTLKRTFAMSAEGKRRTGK